MSSDDPQPRRRVRWLEWAAVFLIFSLEGAWPVPDENETVYVLKAKHYWNADWCAGDLLLDSTDVHWVFYALAGWPSRWMPLAALTWMGRLITWALLAAAWCGLCRRALPAGLWAPLAALVLVAANAWGHLGGEWIVGGFEAKGPAYAAVWMAWSAALASRWASMPVWLGLATALHALVGGWQALPLGLLALADRRQWPRPRVWAAALAAGTALAALGVVPALEMDRGLEAAVVQRAHILYVRTRLAHHLWPPQFGLERWCSHLALIVVTLLALAARRRLARSATNLGSPPPAEARARWALSMAMVIALVLTSLATGLATSGWLTTAQSAGWMRFYWFRLGDVLWPMGLAIAVCQGAARLGGQPRWGFWVAVPVLILLAAAGHGLVRLGQRLAPELPRALAPMSPELAADWREACRWIAENTPADARFFTPRLSQTLKWYAGRPEVVNWKDLPQDSAGIAAWWERIETIHLGQGPAGPRFLRLTDHTPKEWRALAGRFGAPYLLARSQPPLALRRLYGNARWVVYAIDDAAAEPSEHEKRLSRGNLSGGGLPAGQRGHDHGGHDE